MTELVPFDKREGWIWVNGVMTPWQESKTHILSHGLHYASSVFEGERAYNGKIFKSREHSERFKRSAELIGFEIPYSVDELLEAKEKVLNDNNVTDGYVRPVAWCGSKKMAISAQGNEVHVAIAAWEWPNVFGGEDIMKTGLRLTVSEWQRPAPNTAPTASKAAGLYMICTLSKHAAENAGFHDALMLDYRGLLAEATGANLFLVMNNEPGKEEIHTPTPDCFLDGITRRTVMKLAEEKGYKVVERQIKPEELADAKEVFVTGTAAEVKPIASIDAYNFEVGPVGAAIADAYAAEVRK